MEPGLRREYQYRADFLKAKGTTQHCINSSMQEQHHFETLEVVYQLSKPIIRLQLQHF